MSRGRSVVPHALFGGISGASTPVVSRPSAVGTGTHLGAAASRFPGNNWFIALKHRGPTVNSPFDGGLNPRMTGGRAHEPRCSGSQRPGVVLRRVRRLDRVSLIRRPARSGRPDTLCACGSFGGKMPETNQHQEQQRATGYHRQPPVSLQFVHTRVASNLQPEGRALSGILVRDRLGGGTGPRWRRSSDSDGNETPVGGRLRRGDVPLCEPARRLCPKLCPRAPKIDRFLPTPPKAEGRVTRWDHSPLQRFTGLPCGFRKPLIYSPVSRLGNGRALSVSRGPFVAFCVLTARYCRPSQRSPSLA